MAHNIEIKEQRAVHDPKVEPAKVWARMSEIVAHCENVNVIERDNQNGIEAITKTIHRIPLAEMAPAPLGGDLPFGSKEAVHGLIPDLASTGG